MDSNGAKGAAKNRAYAQSKKHEDSLNKSGEHMIAIINHAHTRIYYINMYIYIYIYIIDYYSI